MDDILWRGLVVITVAAVAVLWGVATRRGRAFRRRRVEMPGMDPGLYLFTSEACASCPQARLVLDEQGAIWTEISYQEAPECFAEYRIDRVPTMVHVRADGTGWAAPGIPQGWLVRRWLPEGP